MKKRIFVTATNTDIGKTYVTQKILREYAKRGLRVGVVKPVETGVVDGIYPDGSVLLKLLCELNPAAKELCVSDVVPIAYRLPAAPFVASGGEAFDMQRVQKAIAKMESLCDVLVIEGAGGLYVPIEKEYMVLDLIKSLDAVALLVTHCSLGCINDTLLSQKALESQAIPYATLFNCKEGDASFESVSEPYFDAVGLKLYKSDRDIDTLCDVLYNL